MPAAAICTPKSLPTDKLIHAARIAVDINPVNHAPLERLMAVMPGFVFQPQHIAVVTTKYWHTNGVRLTVGFLDNPPADLRARILSHMNAWSTRLNVSFVESNIEAKVRISRDREGYWSYLGTDILSIAAGQPTMNLQGFTMKTPESEFRRVVRHETGHTIGCPHEHMRGELVARIDRDKAIEYFGATQGWTPQEVEQQVLTPLEEKSLWGTGHADPDSIMCYQIPGSLTVDGAPIIGGTDIDASDYDFMAKVYPKPNTVAGPTIGVHHDADPDMADALAQAETSVARLQADNDTLKRALAIMAR
jgi:hypothetical protein